MGLGEAGAGEAAAEEAAIRGMVGLGTTAAVNQAGAAEVGGAEGEEAGKVTILTIFLKSMMLWPHIRLQCRAALW
jgi:hypothetical protein